ncbi:MAG TPA: hypothetical protein VGL08_08105 [Paraburkholderia sp.]
MNTTTNVSNQSSATLPADTVLKVIINLPDGQSEVEFPNGLAIGSGVSSEVQLLSKPNGTGTLIGDVIDFTNGTSQVFTTLGLPVGETSIKENFSKLDLAGYLTSQDINFANGTSEFDVFSGLANNEVDMGKKFSGLNETGAVIEQAIDFENGTRQLTFFAGPHSQVAPGTLSIEQNFNSLGQLQNDRIQLATGNVQTNLFTYDAAGNVISDRVDIFNSKGQIIASSVATPHATQLVSAMSSFNPPPAGSAGIVQPGAPLSHGMLAVSIH